MVSSASAPEFPSWRPTPRDLPWIQKEVCSIFLVGLFCPHNYKQPIRPSTGKGYARCVPMAHSAMTQVIYLRVPTMGWRRWDYSSVRNQKRKGWEEIHQTSNNPQEFLKKSSGVPGLGNLNIVLLLSLGIREMAITATEPQGTPTLGRQGRRSSREGRESQRG